MPKVISAVYSYEDMKEKWNQDNPDNPYSRRDELQQGIYSLDKWLIRVDDDNRTIATIGWKEYPSHTVVGGLLATNRANKKMPEYEGDHLAKNERALQSAREPQLNQSKPLVAAFGAKTGSTEAWIQRGRDRGWVFSQDEKFSQIKSSIPESVTNEWNSAYPNGNWAIRPITDAESLSKWVFIDDPMPAWFNLLKWLPSSQFNILLNDDGKRVVFKEKNRNKSKYDDRLFYHSLSNTWIRPHYFDKGSQRTKHQPYANDNTQIDTWLEKISQMGFSGRAWFYVNDNPMDLSYVEVVKVPVGGKLPESMNKVTNKKPVEGILFNSFRGSRSRLDAYLGHIGEDKLLDIWETGIKEGHNEGADLHDSIPKKSDDLRIKEKNEKVNMRLSQLFPFKTFDSNKNLMGRYISILQVEDRLQELKDIPTAIEKVISQTKKNKREKKQKYLEKELPNEKEQLEGVLEKRNKLVAEQKRLSVMFKKSWFDILRV